MSHLVDSRAGPECCLHVSSTGPRKEGMFWALRKRRSCPAELSLLFSIFSLKNEALMSRRAVAAVLHLFGQHHGVPVQCELSLSTTHYPFVLSPVTFICGILGPSIVANGGAAQIYYSPLISSDMLSTAEAADPRGSILRGAPYWQAC